MTGTHESRTWMATVNGTRLCVEEAGAGPGTVVYSPALWTNRQMFEPLRDALAGEYRCISYDHRGQGDSGFGQPVASPEVLGTESIYDDALALLDELGVEDCHWVGASVGGFLGFRLAARHPERIHSVTAIGPSMRPLEPSMLRMIDAMTTAVRLAFRLGPLGKPIRERMLTTVMGNMFGAAFMSDPARSTDRDRWREIFSRTMRPQGIPMIRQIFGHPGNPPELLNRIQRPTLLVVGDNPPAGMKVTPEMLAEQEAEELEMTEAIPGARRVVIPGAGHMVLVEEPDAGTKAIVDFIHEVDTAMSPGDTASLTRSP